jgi:uncharacterized protein DUF2785
MHSTRITATTTLLLALIACAPLSGAGHDLPFWRAIARARYAPPPGSDVTSLAFELIDMLASPDAEVRDEIAYSTLASWIYQQKLLDAAALRAATDRLLANLAARAGERDNDTIFRRSFSALTLSVIVARDNAEPFLDAGEWHRIETAAIAYLAAEQDLRGYDPAHGWMHSAAHTADLLKFLGRSRHLEPAGQARLLDAVGGKLRSSAVVFTFGEDERFARALLSLTARKDFDQPGFVAWLTRDKPALPARPSLADLHAIQNWKNVLAKLEVLLSNDPQPSDAAAAARTALRAALKELF